MSAPSEVGAYEAKTHLSQLLRRVRAGQRFTITQRGEPVAALIPVETAEQRSSAQAVERMRRFMADHEPISGVDLKALIDEGRD